MFYSDGSVFSKFVNGFLKPNKSNTGYYRISLCKGRQLEDLKDVQKHSKSFPLARKISIQQQDIVGNMRIKI